MLLINKDLRTLVKSLLKLIFESTPKSQNFNFQLLFSVNKKTIKNIKIPTLTPQSPKGEVHSEQRVSFPL